VPWNIWYNRLGVTYTSVIITRFDCSLFETCDMCYICISQMLNLFVFLVRWTQWSVPFARSLLSGKYFYILKKRGGGLISVPGAILNRSECTSLGELWHCLQWLILICWLLCLVICFCINYFHNLDIISVNSEFLFTV
jgi:hypothetical protein